MTAAASTALTIPEEFSVDRIVIQKAAIQQAMARVMKENEHYGIIPGTKKPSLWQPGADTLCFLFRLRADYEVMTSTESDACISYTVRCRLYHIDTGREWGSGVGACNTREKRYSSQTTERICPSCQKAGTIIKAKEEYGGGWLCWKKKGGCDSKWPDGAPEMETVDTAVASAGVWDLQNTILKMASKRAKVAAVLTATAATDIFTQDIEDLVEYIPPPKHEKTGDELLAGAAARHAAATGTPTTIVQGPKEERRPPQQSAPAPAAQPAPAKPEHDGQRCICVHAPEQHQHATGCEVMGCPCHWKAPAAKHSTVKAAPPPAARPAPAPAPRPVTQAQTGDGKAPRANAAQVKALNAAITGSLGIRDREEKLKWISGMLGYKVSSSRDVPAGKVSYLVGEASAGVVPNDWGKLAATEWEMIELPDAPGTAPLPEQQTLPGAQPEPGWNG